MKILLALTIAKNYLPLLTIAKNLTLKILVVLAIVVQHCVLSRVCSHLLLPLLCP